MTKGCLLALLIASTLAAACSFEQSSKLLTPTAPTGNPGPAGTTTPPANNGSNPSSPNSPASNFSGTWGTSKIPGIPDIGSCSDVKWVITTQSATTVAGTMSANCTGGANVSANLTGEMVGADKLQLTARGTAIALNIPCGFDLTGIAMRQGDDTAKLDYSGTTCLGTVSGTEMLRKFPTP